MPNASIEIHTTEKGIAVITLNRPEKRNALNVEMMEQLCEILDRLQGQADARVAILTGAGPAFCSGLDLSEATDPDKVEQSASLAPGSDAADCLELQAGHNRGRSRGCDGRRRRGGFGLRYRDRCRRHPLGFPGGKTGPRAGADRCCDGTPHGPA
jgi:hypothetical protein